LLGIPTFGLLSFTALYFFLHMLAPVLQSKP
jgi:hypothetical protein